MVSPFACLGGSEGSCLGGPTQLREVALQSSATKLLVHVLQPFHIHVSLDLTHVGTCARPGEFISALKGGAPAVGQRIRAAAASQSAISRSSRTTTSWRPAIRSFVAAAPPFPAWAFATETSIKRMVLARSARR